jgi:hypothetical protein
MYKNGAAEIDPKMNLPVTAAGGHYEFVDDWEDYSDGSEPYQLPDGTWVVPARRSRNVGRFVWLPDFEPQKPVHEAGHSVGPQNPQEEGVKIAQSVLGTVDACKSLFKNKDGLENFNGLVNEKKIVTEDVTMPDRKGGKLSERQDVAGIFLNGKIIINPGGPLARGRLLDPKLTDSYLKGLRPGEVWAVFYIHETAHKTGDFEPDDFGSGSQSILYSIQVRYACFPPAKR